VTIIAPDGITADSLATAVSVLGPKRGIEVIRSAPGTALLFVQRTEQGIRTFQSRFPGN
jgi:thiamine biosynthesis lipoprotein